MQNILWKTKYYFKRVRNIDWQGFFKSVAYAHEQSGKPRTILFFDMIYCSLKYTAGYVDYNEFEFYALNSKQRATYVTLGHSHNITKLFNDNKDRKIFDDKYLFNQKFSKFVNREYINLKESTIKDLENFVRKHGKVMAKRRCDYVGRGISTVYEKDVSDYHKLYNQLVNNDQVLIEEFVQQHEMMNQLSDKSVNTMRVITFVDDHGTPQILVAALKSGLGAEVDNIGQGGMYTILNDEGVVDIPFIDKFGNRHIKNPNDNRDLIGFRVPNFAHLMNQVKEACKIVPTVRYVGWDIAVTPKGNIEIIEGNSTSGPFQRIPSLSKDKTGLLPKYKKHIPLKF